MRTPSLVVASICLGVSACSGRGKEAVPEPQPESTETAAPAPVAAGAPEVANPPEVAKAPAPASLGPEECAARADAIEGMKEGFPPQVSVPELVRSEGWPMLPAVTVPVVSVGWEAIEVASAEIVLAGDGSMRFPDGGAFDVTYRETMAKPAQSTTALQSASDQWRQVVIVADAKAPAAKVRDLIGLVNPRAVLGLAVRKAPAAVIAEHARWFPSSPAAFNDQLAAALDEAAGARVLAIASLVETLRERLGGCQGVTAGLARVTSGGGVDAVAPPVAAALRSCQCRGVDVDVAESAVAFFTLPVPDHAWLRLWAGTDPRWTKLPGGATAQDLADAIAGPR